jgi:altronate dehydratase small subunit
MESIDAMMIMSSDNVATVLGEVPPGTDVRVRLGREVRFVKALEKIPYGFKIAVNLIARGGPVIKYGETIGVASAEIRPGQLVHIHNIQGARGRGDLEKGGRK